MKRAGDVLLDMLRQRVIIRHQRGKIHFAIGQRGKDRRGERRDGINERGDGRALELVCRRDAIKPPQSIVELYRERQPRNGAHRVMRQNLRAAADARHEALEIKLVAGEIELDQRMNRGIGRQQRHAPACHRLEQ